MFLRILKWLSVIVLIVALCIAVYFATWGKGLLRVATGSVSRSLNV